MRIVFVVCMWSTVFLSGCFSQRTVPVAQFDQVTVSNASGLGLTISTRQKGAVSKRDDGIEVMGGCNFDIIGDVTKKCKTGDLIYLELSCLVAPDEWSTLTNVMVKLEDIQDGKARFKSVLSVPDISGRECRLSIEHSLPTMNTRDSIGEFKIHLRSKP